MPEQHRPFADHPCAASHPVLISRAQTLLALAIGQSTRQTYSSGVKSFINFVDKHGIRPAFPASVQTLCLWVTDLTSPPRPLTLGTCKVYLSAVVTRHTEMGFNSPLLDAPPMLDRILTGIKRTAAQTAMPKLPITTAMLEEMRPHLRLQQRSDILLWAMMWTATAGLLRISEFTVRNEADSARTLRTQQLTFYDSEGRTYTLRQAAKAGEEMRYAILHLEASKTDPFRTGADIVISASTALDALLSYATHLSLDSSSPAVPLFHLPDRTAVTRSWLMKNVDRLLRLTGRNPRQYSSHSFRKGGATSLQSKGVEDSLIRRAGRWRSDAFYLYVRHTALDTLVDTNARL
jgi:hypothetical protein